MSIGNKRKLVPGKQSSKKPKRSMQIGQRVFYKELRNTYYGAITKIKPPEDGEAEKFQCLFDDGDDDEEKQIWRTQGTVGGQITRV
jgi:hypothetical protein